MFWTLIGILVLLWLLGFSFEIAGGIIHLLIVIALLLVIFNLLTGRRT
ncbi:lmo0937 family membrane protein [Alkalihalobacterium chitinilyticum]|uniref:Lmo0937 family membrane protein n=1 Tax=Alkalihalobacterium chitinilyticum TaxID=2980103 RepID=A0ABT5VIZ2_9BACI|nr:lmo0937 family membrane protein [Alkalihalobacterium chitinilyticum]MDE5415413.1 lmo0937 family membrane protein [Alkalihalobacterium chitinilyticum]